MAPDDRSREELMAMVEDYESALRQIVSRHDDEIALHQHLGDRRGDHEAGRLAAYKKVSAIARSALRRYHPELP
jgi:hypothetical protein